MCANSITAAAAVLPQTCDSSNASALGNLRCNFRYLIRRTRGKGEAMRLKICIALFVTCLVPGARAAPPHSAPPHEDRLKKVQIKDDRSREFATVLRASEGRRANFAGHFVLASWGCGASCVMGAAIDATSTGPAAKRATSCSITANFKSCAEGSQVHLYLVCHWTWMARSSTKEMAIGSRSKHDGRSWECLTTHAGHRPRRLQTQAGRPQSLGDWPQSQ